MEIKNFKGILLSTLALIMISLTGIGLFLYLVDPYQQYRAKDKYIGNQRLEIGGIARNHDYDAFITGSSMAMNHYPQQADSLWGWRTKNFSIMGATDDDYEVMLPFITDQGKVRNIIMGIDFFSFARQRGAVNSYLYDNNIWNDYEYLWNYTSLSNAFRFLKSKLTEEHLYHFSSPVGLKALVNSYQETIMTGYPEEDFNYKIMRKRFDESIISAVKHAGKDVKWYIYFPPYSIAEFIVYHHHGTLDSNLALKKYMICELSKFPNVELYDFQCSPWIDNLNEYMDVRHHSHSYNRAILKAIYNGEYKTNSGYSEEIKELVKLYSDSLDNRSLHLNKVAPDLHVR